MTYNPPSGPNEPSQPRPNFPPQPPYGQPAYAPPTERPPYEAIPRDVSGKKVAAGVLGILLGSLGIHKFVLGYTGAGLVMLLVSILSCGILSPIFAIIGIIEGIVYLTKTDEDFYQIYVVGQKPWF